MTSRVGRKPIVVPSGVDIKIDGRDVTVTGPKGQLHYQMHPACALLSGSGELVVSANEALFPDAIAQAGTTRAILNNCVKGVSQGFAKKLVLVGVGYRAKAEKRGNRFVVDLTIGVSHPVAYIAPEGIELFTATPTEIEVKGCNRQLVGQVAAEIRKFRAPEPYKGKGIRYSDEVIVLKETKKK